MKTYRAKSFGAAFVESGAAGHYPLDPRLDLMPGATGFAWGCDWKGAQQLALAILCDALDDEHALRLCQPFKERVIMKQNRDAPFELTLDQVLAAIEEIEKEDAR